MSSLDTTLADKVVKFRKLNPFDKHTNRQLSEEMVRRDLVIHQVLTDLTNQYSYYDTSAGQWRQLVEVVPLDDLPQARSEGVIVQPYITGVSARQIVKLVLSYSRFNAAKALAQLQTLGFSDEKDALQKLALLEEFYFLTHQDVLHFSQDNNLQQLYNYVSNGSDENQAVGFDFNHGENVIWSTDLKK